MSQESTFNWVRRGVRFSLLPALLLITTIGGCSCEEDPNNKGDIRLRDAPILSVVPQSVTFSAATPERPETRSLRLTNSGTGNLTAFNFQLEQAGATFSYDADVTTIAEGQSVDITVTYAPDDETPDNGTLVITASNRQRAEVPLNSVPPRRELQCVPDPITFGGGVIGEPQSREVTVTNIGTLDMTLTDMQLEEGAFFAIEATPDFDLVLGPQESTTLTMSFTAESGGRVSDTLRIVIDEDPMSFACPVEGITALPLIDVSPTRIDFGGVEQGEVVQREIRVQNVGAATLELETVEFLRGTSPEFTLVDPPTETVLIEPEESVVITVAYTATTSSATGTVAFFSNDPTTPQVGVPLLGRTSAPNLVVAPSELNFGSVGMGVPSGRTLSMFNDGTEVLDITSIRVEGSGEFTIDTGGDVTSIDPQGEELLRLVYQPSDLGSDQATLIIDSNDPDEPETRVPLLGTGVEGAACEITIQPDPMNFGLVTRGSRRTLPALIRNTGGGLCKFRGATAAGVLNNAYQLASVSHNRDALFGPGEQVRAEVLFTPTVTELPSFGQLTAMVSDPQNGDAEVYCNKGLRCLEDPNHDPFGCGFNPPNCGVSLEGYSGISDIAVIPGSVDFGLVTIGCASQNTTVTVYNTGTADLTVSEVFLEEQGCDEFQIRGTPVLPATVTPNNPVPIQVIYRPVDRGQDQCVLVIRSDASESEEYLRVPLRGEGTNTSRQVDTFTQVSGREVDVIFVIDASGSMSEEQSNVASNLSRFLQTAELLNNDYQIGVVHLDLQDSVRFDGESYTAGRLIGNPAFLTPNTPNVLAEFQRRVELGASGGSQEAGLEGARKAVSDPFITVEGSACNSNTDCEEPYPTCMAGVCGGFNQGFLREDASLEIVIVSDEEDQSTPAPTFYVDFFRSIKGFRNDSLLHVSCIVGANVGNNQPAACSSNNGDADAGRRYAEVCNATGGTVGSICASDFGPFLQNIGNRAFGLRVEFFLSRVAEPASIQVRVNGSARNAGWNYDAATNSVVFDRNTVPEPGDEIEVEYEARCFD